MPTHDGLVRPPETYFCSSATTSGSSLSGPNAISGIGFRMPNALIVADPASESSGKVMLLARGELRERRHRVVADGGDAESFGAQLVQPALQIDELRLAVRAPVRRAVEQQQRALRSHDGRARPGLAVLVREAEVRNHLADLRTELRHIDPGPGRARTSAERSSCDPVESREPDPTDHHETSEPRRKRHTSSMTVDDGQR